MMYNAVGGLYTHTFELEKKETCLVCGAGELTLKISPEITLQEFMDMLAEIAELQLKKPSLRSGGTGLFMQAPPSLMELTKPNLTKKLSELVDDGDVIDVTDPVLPSVAVHIIVMWD
mmetsp:Transcript_16079/g.22349  ORF Transcript_16079/g.22349 Transcript_16079/m.22349 type:complete len:117 (-) Transcript_16079:25-375(-)